MNNPCSCFTCSHLDKIGFLKKNKVTSSDEQEDDTSLQPFNRLPDELLVRILNCIPPINMDNFITFIALEMISKRFLHCMKDNKKILEEMTELVIGFHPHLPDSHYICHIGHFTLELFLRRVKKISKVIVNITDDWLCIDMIRNRFLPNAVDRFGEKMRLQELILHDCNYIEDRSLVQKLINNATPFLQSAQIRINAEDMWHDQVICVGLRKCPNLNNIKLSFTKWTNLHPMNLFNLLPQNILLFLSQLKSIEVVEISGYIPRLAEGVMIMIAHSTLHFPIVRFTNPYTSIAHISFPTARGELDLSYFFSIPHQSTCIRELELHLCAHSHDLSDLSVLLENVYHSIHLKLIFLPYLRFYKVPKIAELLVNAQRKNIGGMKISITFKHCGCIDRENKLAIVYNLLHAFDVPYMPGEGESWEFIRGKLSVELKLEKIEDESLICHPYPAPSE